MGRWLPGPASEAGCNTAAQQLFTVLYYFALCVCRCAVKNCEEENSVVEAYFQCCADTVPDRAMLDMVEQVGVGGVGF